MLSNSIINHFYQLRTISFKSFQWLSSVFKLMNALCWSNFSMIILQRSVQNLGIVGLKLYLALN